jgi:hypothetical protein
VPVERPLGQLAGLAPAAEADEELGRVAPQGVAVDHLQACRHRCGDPLPGDLHRLHAPALQVQGSGQVRPGPEGVLEEAQVHGDRQRGL